jgi:hypothetical protein
MSNPIDPRQDAQPRDAAYWAKPIAKLRASDLSARAVNLIDGKQLTGPIRGFGQMWQKTYWVQLSGADVTPQEVIREWKANFSKFWPKGNTLYTSPAGIVPGETAVINATGPGNFPLMATGVHVIYADDESFAYMTPAGHPFNGMITFSAYEEAGATLAQVQLLVRPFDPLYEIGFRLRILSKMEDLTWNHTLRSLAAHFGVQAKVDQRINLVDPKVQWSEAKNIWHNAGIRTALYTVATPLRWARNLFKRK